MILTLSIFLFGIALAFAMIARKIWLLRSGQIVPGSYEASDWTELSVEAIRNRLVELLKTIVHYAVLFALKAWIIVYHAIRRADKKVRAKLTHIIHKNAQYPIGTTDRKPSDFLAGIKEHREEVMSGIDKDSLSAK